MAKKKQSNRSVKSLVEEMDEMHSQMSDVFREAHEALLDVLSRFVIEGKKSGALHPAESIEDVLSDLDDAEMHNDGVKYDAERMDRLLRDLRAHMLKVKREQVLDDDAPVEDRLERAKQIIRKAGIKHYWCTKIKDGWSLKAGWGGQAPRKVHAALEKLADSVNVLPCVVPGGKGLNTKRYIFLRRARS